APRAPYRRARAVPARGRRHRELPGARRAVTPERVRIARLRRRDLTAVVAIERTQFDDPWTEGMLRDELASDTRRYTKAKLDRELVGYLGLMFVDTEAHVNSIA